MHILAILESSAPSDEQHYVELLAKELAKQEIRMSIVYVSGHPGQFCYQSSKDFVVPHLCFRVHENDWTEQVASWMNNEAVDHVLVSRGRYSAISPITNITQEHALVDILASLSQKPKVIFMAYEINNATQKAAAAINADVYAAVSHNAARVLEGKEHVVVRGAAVEPESTGTNIRELFGIPPTVFVLGYIGTLSERHGTKLLLEAAEEMKAYLIVCGRGDMIDEVEEKSHFVRLLPEVPPSRKDWYEAVNVFVYPLHSAGFPFLPLESIMSGTPVAMTPVSDFYSIFGESVAFCHPTKEALVEAVNKASKMGVARAKEIADEELSIEKMIDGFLALTSE